MKCLHLIHIVYSVGILHLIGCREEVKDTSTNVEIMDFTNIDNIDNDNIDITKEQSDPNTMAKRQRAQQVIRRLQENVRVDLPQHVNQKEEIVLDIEKQIIHSLEEDLLARNVDMFLSKISSEALLSIFENEYDHPFRNEMGIQEFLLSSTQSTKEHVQENWSSWLNHFSDIEHASVDIHDVNFLHSDSVSLDVFLDIRGENTNGSLQQERGWITINCQKQNTDWVVTSLVMEKKEVLITETTIFDDITEKSGLSSVPLYSRLEALRRGGYAISVGDLNGDQYPDVYVGGWGESRVYQNDGTGSFTDITDTTNLSTYRGSTVDRVKAAAISDLDNDGDQDLILSRFIDDTSEDLLVFMNDGTGDFTSATQAIQKKGKYDRAMPLTVADFNGDGHNDLYVGFPGARDFTYLDSSPNPLQTQGLFLNDGTGLFLDSTEQFGLGTDTESVSVAYPHASVKADFNGDGNIDLLIADDRRGVSHVYENTGKNSFQPVDAVQSGIDNRAWAMGIAVGDYDNDGFPDLYYSNIDFLAAKRLDSFLGDDMQSELFVGNHLYKNMGDGTFMDVTKEAGVGWAGEAAAGADWFDYDNDGDLDLYVLNGLWTGPGDQELSSLFVRAYASELILEQNNRGSIKSQISKDAISLRNPGFNNMIIQSLMHFTGDLTKIDEAVDPNQMLPSLQLGGNQRNALFRNNGDGTFTEIGYLAGLDSIDDGYMPAFSDINNDGNIDVLVRACDPGTEAYQYPSLRVFQNKQQKNNSLIVTLEGDPKYSNRDAVGAKIKAVIQDQDTTKTMIREINTVSGAAQSEKAAFFGVQQLERVAELVITWPSGTIQTLSNVPVGRIHIKETNHPVSEK